MSLFIEAEEDGAYNIPVIGRIAKLQVARTGEGVGLVGETIVRSPDGTPARFRIQMSNAAILDALEMLGQYAKAAGLLETGVRRNTPPPLN